MKDLHDRGMGLERIGLSMFVLYTPCEESKDAGAYYEDEIPKTNMGLKSSVSGLFGLVLGTMGAFL